MAVRTSMTPDPLHTTAFRLLPGTTLDPRYMTPFERLQAMFPIPETTTPDLLHVALFRLSWTKVLIRNRYSTTTADLLQLALVRLSRTTTPDLRCVPAFE